MAISNFIPEIWTSGIVEILKKKLVAEAVTNRQYDGEVAANGNVVHIIGAGSVADNAYPASSNITYSAVSDTTSDLNINLNRYCAFEAPDLDVAQSKVAFVEMTTRDCAYQIADYFDTQVLAEYANASLDSYKTGSTAWQFLITCSDFPRLPAAIVRQLEAANAPAGQPYMVLPPEGREAALRYLGPRASNLGDQVMTNGFIGNLMGVNMYTSNNLDSGHGLAGIEGDGIALAYQVNMMEALRLEGRISDGVRMLVNGGIKTYRPAIQIDINLDTTLIATS